MQTGKNYPFSDPETSSDSEEDALRRLNSRSHPPPDTLTIQAEDGLPSIPGSFYFRIDLYVGNFNHLNIVTVFFLNSLRQIPGQSTATLTTAVTTTTTIAAPRSILRTNSRYKSSQNLSIYLRQRVNYYIKQINPTFRCSA